MSADILPQGQPQVGTTDLLAFMRGKLADAEKALRCRQEMANVKPLTDEDMAELAKMPGVIITKGRRLSKAEIKDREEEPQRQKRIAIKCRHEVDMIKAVIRALTPCQHNTARDQGWTECPTCDATIQANTQTHPPDGH